MASAVTFPVPLAAGPTAARAPARPDPKLIHPHVLATHVGELVLAGALKVTTVLAAPMAAALPAP